MQTSITIKVVTFVNKDNENDTVSVVGDENVTAESYEGHVFGEYLNTTGLWKSMKFMRNKGHRITEETFEHTVNY